MNEIETFNQTLFLLAWRDILVRYKQTAIGIADDVIYLIPLLLAGLWLWGDYARRSLALKACLVALLGVAANQAIGALWPHPRPFIIGLGHAWMPHAAD